MLVFSIAPSFANAFVNVLASFIASTDLVSAPCYLACSRNLSTLLASALGVTLFYSKMRTLALFGLLVTLASGQNYYILQSAFAGGPTFLDNFNFW